jgi:DNA (cytosine-5)-methyltransferase 1
VGLRLLDAFSCAGLGAEGYRRAGFEVVCLDLDHRPLKHARAAGFETVQGDAVKLLNDHGFMAQFDAVHASPPCQVHSATRALANAQGKGTGRGIDLIPQTLEALHRLDIPWILENVERSPVSKMPGAVRLCGSSFGLQVQRHRWFAPSADLTLLGTECFHGVFAVDDATGRPRPWGVYGSLRDNIPSGGRTVQSIEHGHEVMGVTDRRVPWKYLCEGLPPAYTAWLGVSLYMTLVGTSPSSIREFTQIRNLSW